MMPLEEMSFVGDEKNCFEQVQTSLIVEKISWVVICLYSAATEKCYLEYELEAEQSPKSKTRALRRIPDS